MKKLSLILIFLLILSGCAPTVNSNDLVKITGMVCRREIIDNSLTTNLDEALREKVLRYNESVRDLYRNASHEAMDALGTNISYENYSAHDEKTYELVEKLAKCGIYGNAGQLISTDSDVNMAFYGRKMPDLTADQELLSVINDLAKELPPDREGIRSKIENRRVVEDTYLITLGENERALVEEYNVQTAEYRQKATDKAIEYVLAHSNLDTADFDYFVLHPTLEKHITDMADCALYEQGANMIYTKLIPLTGIEIAGSGASFPRFYMEELAIPQEYYTLVEELLGELS